MKNLVHCLLLAAMATSLLTSVGCARTPKDPDPSLLEPSTFLSGISDVELAPVEFGALPDVVDFANATVHIPEIDIQPVYFAYDSSVIGTSEQGKVQVVFDYVQSKPHLLLQVEGHCDERGSREYNIALSDRRALAVRDYLITLGVDPGRINTVPHGEEYPADLEHTEAAWSANRRGEFKFLVPGP